ncbi:hypothetical protein GCM10026983_32680 [Gracilibacillus alcaliphilus]
MPYTLNSGLSFDLPSLSVPIGLIPKNIKKKNHSKNRQIVPAESFCNLAPIAPAVWPNYSGNTAPKRTSAPTIIDA